MFSRRLMLHLVLVTACAGGLFGQQKSQAADPQLPAARQEFPVILQQSVTAGKTPVGTKIQAKLAIATLINGTVVPRNAVFSGEVVESVKKTAKEASRLVLRMDLVTWKDGSTAITAFVIPWFYPTVSESGQDLQYGPPQPPSRTWNGAGAYPDPNSPAYKPFPEAGEDKSSSVPDTPSSVTSKNREQVKNVQAERGSGGTIALVSKNRDIKLERFTTYVLAGNLMPTK